MVNMAAFRGGDAFLDGDRMGQLSSPRRNVLFSVAQCLFDIFPPHFRWQVAVCNSQVEAACKMSWIEVSIIEVVAFFRVGFHGYVGFLLRRERPWWIILPEKFTFFQFSNFQLEQIFFVYFLLQLGFLFGSVLFVPPATFNKILIEVIMVDINERT